jgi:hypothetical protein
VPRRATLRVLAQEAKGGVKTVHRLSVARKSRKPLHAITSQMRPIPAPIHLKPLRRRASMRAISPPIEVRALSSSSSSASSNDEDAGGHHEESGSDNRRDDEEDKASAAATATERVYARKGARNVPLWLAGDKERGEEVEDAAADHEIIEITALDEFEPVDNACSSSSVVPVAPEEDEDEGANDCIIVGVYSPPKIAKSPPRRMKTPTFLKRKNRRCLRLAISPGDHNPPDEKPKHVARVRRESRSKKRKNSLDADVSVWPSLSATTSGASNKREKTAKTKQKTALQKPCVSKTQVPRDGLCIDSQRIAIDDQVLPLNLPRNNDENNDERGENHSIDIMLDPLTISSGDDDIKCVVHSDSDDYGGAKVAEIDEEEEDGGDDGDRRDSSQYDNAGVFEDNEFAFPSQCNQDGANRRQQECRAESPVWSLNRLELKRSYELAYNSRNGIRPSLADTTLAGFLQQLAKMHANAEMQTQRWSEPTLRVFLENAKVDVGPCIDSHYEFAGSVTNRRSDFDRVGSHYVVFGQDGFGQWIVLDLKIWVSPFFFVFLFPQLTL